MSTLPEAWTPPSAHIPCAVVLNLQRDVLAQRERNSSDKNGMFAQLEELKVLVLELKISNMMLLEMKNDVAEVQKSVEFLKRVVSKAEGAKWVLGLLVAGAGYIFSDDIRGWFHR